ncbi:MAG: hypothetical protein ACP5QA_03385 [Phycisphaerae bacterium]
MKELDRRFATALKNLCDAPASMAQRIRLLSGMFETPDVLIFSPAFTTMDIFRPASLLALTRTHWAVALSSEPTADGTVPSENISAFASPYSHTLAVGLKILLLDGRLAMHAHGNTSTALIVYFNTVMEKIYREAAFFALDQMTAKAYDTGVEIPGNRNSSETELPMKFHSALERFTPPGRTVCCYVAWPAVFGGFYRQLSPAAMLVRTQHELILISDEPPAGGFFDGPQQYFGYVVTYMPLQRIRAASLHGSGKLITVQITLTAGDNLESISILVPSESSSAAVRIANPAL